MKVRSKLKGFTKDASLYGLGNALGRMAGIVMLPILSRIFTPEQYGVVDLLSISYAFALIVHQLGAAAGLQRFYFRVSPEERRTMVTSCVVTLVALSGVTAVVVSFAAQPIARLIGVEASAAVSGIRYLAVCMPINIVYTFSLLLLRMQRRAVAFSCINIVNVILTTALTYIFVVALGLSIDGVFLARLTSFSLVVVVVLALTHPEYGRRFRFSAVRKVVRFGLPGHPGLIVRSSMDILPRYLLAASAPLAAVGLFGIAMRVTRIIKIIVGSFNLAWNPFAYENEGNPDERRIYEIVFKGFFGAVLLLGLTLSLYSREFLAVMAPGMYAPARILVPGIALHFGLEGLTTILSTILYTRERVRWASYLNVMRIGVFLVVGSVLIPRLQAVGVVVAMDVASILYFVAYVLRTQTLFSFHVPWFGVLASLGLATGAVLGFDALLLTWGWALPLKFLVIAMLGSGMFYLLFSAEERRSISSQALRRARGVLANG